MVSAYVDDWSTSIHSPEDLREVRRILRDYEKVSGQRINSDKSAMVPSRKLTQEEEREYQDAWGASLRVSHFERVLGVYIGTDATVEKQYSKALEKLDDILELYSGIKDTLTTALRVAAANVFLISLFFFPEPPFRHATQCSAADRE